MKDDSMKGYSHV